MGHLRLKDVLDISSVQYAILETNGSLSVFPYPEHKPASAMDAGISTGPQSLPVTVVQDGKLFPGDLGRSGKDAAWLASQLEKRGAKLKNTLLLSVDARGHVTFIRKEAGK